MQQHVIAPLKIFQYYVPFLVCILIYSGCKIKLGLVLCGPNCSIVSSSNLVLIEFSFPAVDPFLALIRHDMNSDVLSADPARCANGMLQYNTDRRLSGVSRIIC